MVKARTPLLSIIQCHAPFSTAVVSMEIVVQVYQLFFPGWSCKYSEAKGVTFLPVIFSVLDVKPSTATLRNYGLYS